MVFVSSDRALPPTDGSVPLGSVIDFHLQHNPKHTWAILSGTDSSPPVPVTYEQLGFAVHRAAHILNPEALLPRGTQIGILISADTVVYLALLFGAMRAGLVPFPLSPRTQAAGIGHLLKSTQTRHILVGGSRATEELWGKIQSLPENQGRRFEVKRIPSASELFPDLSKGDVKIRSINHFPALGPTTSESLVAIMHSSGSTGFPRALKLNQESAFTNLVHQPACWELGGPGDRIGLMVLPAFHLMGFTWHGIMPLYVGYSPVFFAFSPTPIVPTPESTMNAMVSTGCQALMSIPAFLEAWSKDAAAVSQLKRLRGLTKRTEQYFGGGALAEWVGNSLANNGVRLQSAYGATEIGCINKLRPTNPQRSPEDWAYLEFSEQSSPRFIPQHDEDGTYELVVLAIDAHKPIILNCELDGQPAYATKDLMVPHPTKPGLWKTIGRLDDQIVLANGEKTNPGTMEDVITSCPHVELAAMFGRERNQTGVLLELTVTAQSNYRGKGRAQLMADIWSFIERANDAGPSHARLIQEAVVFTYPEVPLLRTPKGTLSRAATLKAYSKEIERMYAALERNESVPSPSEAPSWGDRDQVEGWLKLCAQRVLRSEVDVDIVGDLFQQGLDSLTATMLTRTILNTLNSSASINAQRMVARISQETLFKYPSIFQLSGIIVQLFTDPSHSLPESSNDSTINSITRMIQKYDRVPALQLSPELCSPPSERVLLTGTTGGLGSHLLAQLLANDRVERVWALNRRSHPNGRSLRQRQCDAFQDKQLDVALLDSPKLVLLESNIAVEQLGLPSEIYEEVKSTSSLFIHNAWQVNFNLSLQSFEPSIRGTYNLIDLALASKHRPRFLFTSSVSAAGFGTPGGYINEAPVDIADAATSIGYGQSKFVAEKLLESARTSGLETCAIRLGQLTGDSNAGAWSLNDWVPSMVASSIAAGYLPDAVGTISWTPLDVVAQAVVEISLGRKAILPPFVHCSHPCPIEWSQVMTMFSGTLRSRTNGPLPVVPIREWNDRVERLVSASEEKEEDRLRRFPTAKIQSTIDQMVRADEKLRARIEANSEGNLEAIEAGGTARLDTTQGVRLSLSLKAAKPLGQQDVAKWVDHWIARRLFV
ncbi:hypothetical protein FRC10_011139 [Ceratobasidium sp. 414]|nr:hypothetical protein FRC10_011139 [Ceratobasidium sp. 414]